MSQPHLPPKVFVSYAHEDTELKKKFDVNLKALRGDRMIDYWTDGEILAGDRWSQEITDAMNEAELIILLVSNYFITSEFIQKEEIPMAMMRVNQGKAIIVSVILSETPSWANSDLNTFQALPSGVVPVDDPQWRKPERAFANVEKELRKLIPTLPNKLAKQARRWSEATGGSSGTGTGGTTGAPPAPGPKKGKRALAWAAALLLLGAGITAGIMKWSGQEQMEISPELQAWLAASKVDHTVVEISAAKGNGYFQNGLQPLVSKNEKVTARRLHELAWEVGGKPARVANGITWDLVVDGVAKEVTAPVKVTVYFQGKNIGVGKADPQDIKLDPNDPGGWALLATMPPMDSPPGFTHVNSVEATLSYVWDKPCISPQIFSGRNGEIPAGIHRVAIEARIENRPVYRALLDLEVPPRIYAQPRAEWVAGVKDPKMAVSLVDPVCTWPSADKLVWKVKLTGDPAQLKEPLAFQYYYSAEDIYSTRDSAWKVDIFNALACTSIEIEQFNRFAFLWGPAHAQWKDGSVTVPLYLNCGTRGHFSSGPQEIALEVLSRGEPVWRGLMKLEVPAEPWSYPDEKNKIRITDINDKDIRSAVLQAKRADPYSADPALNTGLSLDTIRFHKPAESLTGPFTIQFYIKDGRPSHSVTGSATMTPEPFSGIFIWEAPDSGGFIARASGKIDDKVLPDHTSPVFYIGRDKAKISPGLHEIGIEIVDGNNSAIYRGITQVNLP